jgi:hypothetical protein
MSAATTIDRIALPSPVLGGFQFSSMTSVKKIHDPGRQSSCSLIRRLMNLARLGVRKALAYCWAGLDPLIGKVTM